MSGYAVVLFDDGIYAVAPTNKVRCTNGQYSAKWKNIYYNVNYSRLERNQLAIYLSSKRVKGKAILKETR